MANPNPRYNSSTTQTEWIPPMPKVWLTSDRPEQHRRVGLNDDTQTHGAPHQKKDLTLVAGDFPFAAGEALRRPATSALGPVQGSGNRERMHAEQRAMRARGGGNGFGEGRQGTNRQRAAGCPRWRTGSSSAALLGAWSSFPRRDSSRGQRRWRRNGRRRGRPPAVRF